MSEIVSQPGVGGDPSDLSSFNRSIEFLKQEYPLLTADDEVVLAKRIEAGLYAEYKIGQAEINGEPLDDIDDYRTIAEEGREARDRFILSNQGLIIDMAKGYMHGHRLEEPYDVMQNGQEGLIRAVEKFDYRMGYKFSTYATAWIKQGFYRNGRNGLIKLPADQKDELGRIKRYQGNFFEEHGVWPTLDQISESVGSKEERIKELLVAANVISLSAPINDEGGGELADIVTEATTEDHIAESLELQEREALIARALGELTQREQHIVKAIFGFNGDGIATASQVSRDLDLSRQRISMIKNDVLEKLRKSLASHDTLAV